MAQQNAGTAGALSGIRVLDLSGATGNYCGKLFADLGADVILVEPLHGTELRRAAPYAGHSLAPDAGLAFSYMNTNKRSIALDLDTPEGQAILHKLAGTAQLLLETGRPGDMDARGLGYRKLSTIQPSLVYVSITPFGQTGPYAHFEADDMTLLAMSGLLSLGGYADDVPVVAYGNQAYAAGSLFAAVASMAALLDAETSGRGEHIDVSIQECVALALENAAQAYFLEKRVRKRYGTVQREAGSGIFKCKDGYVYVLAGGVSANRFWELTKKWLGEAGVVGVEEFHKVRWTDRTYLATQEAKDLFSSIFDPYVVTRTKAELYADAKRLGMAIAPVATPDEVLSSEQFRQRNYFVDVFNPVLGRTVRQPGAPYKLSETPWSIRQPAPSLGGSTAEILGELGIGAEEQAALHQARIV